MMSKQPEQPLFVKIAPGIHRYNASRCGTGELSPEVEDEVSNEVARLYRFFGITPPPASPLPASGTGEAAATEPEVPADE